MPRDVLLLNESEEIIKIIDWKKAVVLLESGKAKKPFAYDRTYRIKLVSGEYKLPAAIVLIKYVNIPWNSHSKPTRKKIFKRDNWTCQYCGRKSKDKNKLTVDHVHPRSMGGGWQWTNLTTACRSCNEKKGHKLLKVCGMKLANKPKKPTLRGIQAIGMDKNGTELWSRWIYEII
jgi:hypothetical protein